MIRPAEPGDASAIARIQVQAWQTAYAEIIPTEYLANLSVERSTKFWSKELTLSHLVVFVVVDDGSVVGWASGGAGRDADGPGCSEVFALYVSPKFWSAGFGRQLMSAIEASLPPNPKITLWVLEQNAKALGFYQSMGYQSDGAAKTVSLGGKDLVEIRLLKTRRGDGPAIQPG